MHAALPISLAVLVSAAIIVIGILYIAAPQLIIGGFGLKPIFLDPVNRSWLRTKGVRDVASGVTVLLLLLMADHRTLGIVLLALALIPLGDMLNVLASGGSRVTAFTVHGLTCLVMVLAASLFLQVF